MIGRIRGTLIEKQPPTICVDVGGVGYEIDVPMSTLYQMPELGAQVNLFTHLAIREDAHVLFGFSSLNERSTFKALIKVTWLFQPERAQHLQGTDQSHGHWCPHSPVLALGHER